MRSRPLAFALLPLAAAALGACNLIFGVTPGVTGNTGGGGGATSSAATATGGHTAGSSTSTGTTGTTSTGTGGGPSCSHPNSATCDAAGVLQVCDGNSHSLAPQPCGVVAACDAAAQKCIDAASLGRISVGYQQVCAIEDNRGVSCWGYNNQTALVPGDLRTLVSSAAPVNGLAMSVRQISVGSFQKCALMDDGSVWCWGGNSNAELGNQDPNIQPPVQVMGLSPAVEVRAANGCTCARLPDGSVDCWGQGGQGKGCLGTGKPPMMGAPPMPAWWTPTPIAGVTGAVQLVTSAASTWCARQALGQVLCWNEGVDPSPIPMVGDALDVAAGMNVVILRSKQQGLMYSVPTADGLHWQAPVKWMVPNVASLTAIAAGNDFCGLLAGEVACTLLNGGPPSSNPVKLPGQPGGTVAEIASGYGSPDRYDLAVSCLRLASPTIAGNVYCWGDDAGGALGAGAPDYSASPVAVPAIVGATSLSTSRWSTSVVLGTGEARIWGRTGLLMTQLSAPTDDLTAFFGTDNVSVHYNDYPQDGYIRKKAGPPVYYLGTQPMAMGRLLSTGFTDYTDLYPFGDWDMGLRAGGQVIVYGYGNSDDPNGGGIFGDGTLMSVQGEIKPVGTLSAKAISAQGYGYGSFIGHACAYDASGAALCWGTNGSGEVGNGDMTGNPVAAPALVKNLPDPVLDPVLSIAVGWNFSCAVTTTLKVYCWGRNDVGQLGYSGPSTLVAKQLMTLPPATAVVAQDAHACALLMDKSVWCWGENDWGQLGNGTFLPAMTPGPVVSLAKDVVQLSTASLHTCARHMDGSVSCWGGSDRGQLGQGVTGEFDAAQQVKGL